MSSTLSNSTGLTVNNNNIGFNMSGNMSCVNLNVNNVVSMNSTNSFGGILLSVAGATGCVTNNYNTSAYGYGSFCSSFGGITASYGTYITINLPPNTMCFINAAGGLNTGSPGSLFQTASWFVCTNSSIQSIGNTITLSATGLTGNYNGNNTFTFVAGGSNFPIVYSVLCVGPVV